MFFKKKLPKQVDAIIEAKQRDIFFYIAHGETYTYDPLQTYCDLKEIGFDAFGKQLQGVLRGEPRQTKLFVDSMKKVFNVETLADSENGFTVMELADLYIKFFSFVDSLKKNYTLLEDFAPSMEREWRVLRKEKSEEQPDSDEKATSSDSQKTSQQPPLREESQVSTEPPEPSAV